MTWNVGPIAEHHYHYTIYIEYKESNVVILNESFTTAIAIISVAFNSDDNNTFVQKTKTPLLLQNNRMLFVLCYTNA